MYNFSKMVKEERWLQHQMMLPVIQSLIIQKLQFQLNVYRQLKINGRLPPTDLDYCSQDMPGGFDQDGGCQF